MKDKALWVILGIGAAMAIASAIATILAPLLIFLLPSVFNP
ncbi:hypothetical protein GCM10009422_13860 [Brevundimonas kwangchunensis]|uniref:Uncharacterized protein n=1 Tax=Brevundimonas kwangchunensis TaxID=322163 RepID=A0ABP3S0Z4_9CAUL